MATVTREREALIARLVALANRYDMTATERYEADAEAFYRETGYMSPGKDVPMAMGGQDERERRDAYDVWSAKRNQAQQAALIEAAAALASPPAEDANRAKLAAAVLDVAQRLESCGVVGRDLHLRTCIGDEDTPCNCGADDPAEVLRGIAEALTWPPSRAQAPPASDPPGLVANWRPIETAPKRTDVLAGWADRPHWLPQVLQQDDAGMWFNGEESDYRPPTHWMPLPASPQAETKGDES